MKEEYKMAKDIIEKELKSLRHYVDNEKFLKSMNEWKKENLNF